MWESYSAGKYCIIIHLVSMYKLGKFVVPNEAMRKAAIGSLAGCGIKLKKVLEDADSFHQPIPAPSSFH